MATIKGSVGIGGKNRQEDVKLIQQLLNNFLSLIGRRTPVSVDGFVGPETTEAIVKFQSNVVGMVDPDGRVDPGGSTIAALQKPTTNLIQLPADGVGYYRYTTSKTQFGTRKTIQSVKSVARQMHADHGLEIGIGHISLAGGGKFPPHRSHQRGVDVDIRPLRSDGARKPITINDAAYSRDRTRKLVKLLAKDPNLKSILFNDSIANVIEFPGHHNHLHVRFLA